MSASMESLQTLLMRWRCSAHRLQLLLLPSLALTAPRRRPVLSPRQLLVLRRPIGASSRRAIGRVALAARSRDGRSSPKRTRRLGSTRCKSSSRKPARAHTKRPSAGPCDRSTPRGRKPHSCRHRGLRPRGVDRSRAALRRHRRCPRSTRREISVSSASPS